LPTICTIDSSVNYPR